MTWVALHEVTHAVQFAGRAVAARPRRRARARAARAAPSCGIDAPRKLRHADRRRGPSASGGALRHGDLISIVTTRPSARRSTACRR